MPEATEAHSEGYKAGNDAANNRILRHLQNIVPSAAGIIKDAELADVEEKIKRIMETVPEERTRRRIFHKVRRLLGKDHRELANKIEDTNRQTTFLRRAIDATEKIEEWIEGDLKLQKPEGTMMHSFREALAAGQVFDLPSKCMTMPEQDINAWDEMASSSSLFMVHHNWADAFKNARDYLGGELRLPDDACAFEFCISDRRVIVFATEADGILYLQHAIKVKKGWILLRVANGKPNPEDKFLKLTSEQVRAIAVALDAEIATTEIIRAPHKLNHAREKAGKLPLVSYHVVNLAHRSRGTPLESSDHEPVYHVRLHFRRGHWRHYEDHKTWIKWMLVGDPELGFVDKEYRL